MPWVPLRIEINRQDGSENKYKQLVKLAINANEMDMKKNDNDVYCGPNPNSKLQLK